MNTTILVDESNQDIEEKSGSQLARIREKKGISQEYVAGKLHLRVKIIQLLEADEYQQLPEPVFIKGYLRAYAKLLGISPEPYLMHFNSLQAADRKLEKALWQSKRESSKGEGLVKWATVLVIIVAVVVVGLWWQKNNDEQPVLAVKEPEEKVVTVKPAPAAGLNNVSTMQSMFSSSLEPASGEMPGE